MKNVYVVTDGQYSDYAIKAIFSNKQLAFKYKEIHHYDDVEIWELDYDKKNIKNALLKYYVHISPQGKIKGATLGVPIPKDGWMNCDVKARNQEHAVKIVADKYAAELYKIKIENGDQDENNQKDVEKDI